MRAYLFTLSIFLLGILTGYRLHSNAEAGKAAEVPLQMRVTYPGIRSVYSVNQALNK